MDPQDLGFSKQRHRQAQQMEPGGNLLKRSCLINIRFKLNIFNLYLFTEAI
jgi:hypothetical protein